VDVEHICQIVDTVIDLSVHSKRALLRDLAHRAALVLKVDDDDVFNALLRREELGSTGVGNGVALPHVRLEQVKKPIRNTCAIERADRFRCRRWATRRPGLPAAAVKRKRECAAERAGWHRQKASKAGAPRGTAPRAQSRCTLQSHDRKHRSLSVAVKQFQRVEDERRRHGARSKRLLVALTALAINSMSQSRSFMPYL